MSVDLEEKDGNYLSHAWEVLSRLSDEALNAVREAADQKKFDKSRGIVGLDESLINLTSSRNLLRDAIEKNSLQQLPLSLQKRFFSDLSQIQESVGLLSNGTDEIVVLTDRIETLNSDIWRFGLHNLSNQVLGYQTKLNQLKHQETQLLRLQDEIKKALELRDKAEEASKQIASMQSKIADEDELISMVATEVTEKSANVHHALERASADLASVQKVSEDAARLLAGVTTYHGNVTALHDEVTSGAHEIKEVRESLEILLDKSTQALDRNSEEYRSLHEQVETDSRDLSETLSQKVENLVKSSNVAIQAEVETAKTSVAGAIEQVEQETAEAAQEHQAALQKALKSFESERTDHLESADEEIKKLIADSSANNKAFLENGQADHAKLKTELEDLENQIRDKIYQATGYTLFGAFQSRQNAVAKAKQNWAIATLACVFMALLVGIYIVHAIHSVQDVRFEFFAKLSLSLPIIYAIGFCSIQYSKERRLEEEYAFKSSVSVSLKPYQELVAELVTKTDEAELAKYTAFVIASVQNVFSSPTDKVFETPQKEGGVISEGTVKQVSKLIEPLVQIAARK
jgi:chromosome segregation ATPase